MQDSIYTQIYMRTYGLTKPRVCTHDHEPSHYLSFFMFWPRRRIWSTNTSCTSIFEKTRWWSQCPFGWHNFTMSGPTGQFACWDIWGSPKMVGFPNNPGYSYLKWSFWGVLGAPPFKETPIYTTFSTKSEGNSPTIKSIMNGALVHLLISNLKKINSTHMTSQRNKT